MGRKLDRICRSCSDENMFENISKLNKEVKRLLERNSRLESTLATVLIDSKFRNKQVII
jgi:hypothetical protein